MTDDVLTQVVESLPEPPEPDWIQVGLNKRATGGGALTKIMARFQSYSSNGRGSAEHRRVMLPGENTAQWATDAGETEGDFGSQRGQGRDYVFVPEGTIVVSYETETTKYGKGRAKLDAGVVADASEPPNRAIAWGLTVRRKGTDVVVTLPDGTKLVF